MRFLTAQPDTASVYDMQRLETVWLALHIAGGQVGLPLAVLTFILASRSSGRPRYLTLINFCITWIIYSISYCLLLYAGQADQNLDSPTHLCIAQAALIHGATPMAAIAGLEMVLQLWFVQKRIHRTDFPYIRKIPERWLNFLILVQPYIVFIGFSSLALGSAMQDENVILSLNHIYCTSQNYLFSLIVPIFCALVITGIFFVEVMIYYNWYRARKEVNALLALQPGEFAVISKEYQHRGLSTSISVRVGLFTLYCIATLSACIVFVSNKASSFPYMVESSLPLAAFLTLGTQKDLIQLWLCCKRRRKPSEVSVNEKAIPSARSLSNSPSIESILAPSTIISLTFTSPDSPRDSVKSKNRSNGDWDSEDDETIRRASEELV